MDRDFPLNDKLADTTDWGYWFFQGTSMSTPHVSGVAALILAHDSTLTPDQLRHALESTAEDLGNLGRDDVYGWGLIDAKATLQSVMPDQHTFELLISGNGTVMVDPDQATYLYGTNVTLTAFGETGWTFAGWSGDLSGSDSPETITMDGNKTITAIFISENSVPLSGWVVDPMYTNAPYTLDSNPSVLSLELDAANTSNRVTIYTLYAPKLNLTDYASVNVSVTGTSNARILLRFFLDNGSSFDVVYWASPSVLDAKFFAG